LTVPLWQRHHQVDHRCPSVQRTASHEPWQTDRQILRGYTRMFSYRPLYQTWASI